MAGHSDAGGRSGGDGFPANLPPAPFGAAQGYVQFISPQGALVVPGGQRSPAQIVPRAQDTLIARRGSGSSFTDRTVGSTRLRVLTLGSGARGAVMVARPLTEVNHELRTLLLLLAVIGVVGIALAMLLGALVARTALAPIARFTRRTETLSASLRANIQVLQEAQRLPPHELEGLREDVVAELDELTALVGDVVAPAR